MIIVLHVIIALSSIAFTTVTFFMPSSLKINIAASLVAATLASGTYLVWSSHSRIIEACLMGLFYTAGVTYGIVAAQRKLTAIEVRSNAKL
jgi:fumarate reductase subunit C